MKSRNTLQRRLVLDTVRIMRSHPTADEVYARIAAENPQISKATVYRNLRVLAEKGEILHIPLPDGADCFDYLTTPHYHLRCRKCRRVFDIQSPPLTGFNEVCALNSAFRIESHMLVFTGLCPDCRRKEEEIS